jgi:hypothetical protein
VKNSTADKLLLSYEHSLMIRDILNAFMFMRSNCRCILIPRSYCKHVDINDDAVLETAWISYLLYLNQFNSTCASKSAILYDTLNFICSRHDPTLCCAPFQRHSHMEFVDNETATA